jgi:hypothetical protein
MVSMDARTDEASHRPYKTSRLDRSEQPARPIPGRLIPQPNEDGAQTQVRVGFSGGMTIDTGPPAT